MSTETSVEQAPGPADGPDHSLLLQILRSPVLSGEVRWTALLMAAGAGVFALTRGVLLATFSERFVEVPGGEIARAFLVGLRMDVSLLGFLLLPVWLLCFLPKFNWSTSVAVRAVTSAWVTLCALVVVLGSVADVIHYGEIDARLGASILDDLRQPAVLVDAVTRNFKVAALLGAVVVLAIFLGTRLHRWAGRLAGSPARGRWRWAVGCGLLLLLARGAYLDGPPARWWGEAYFSDHYAANQLALNGTYNVGLAWLSEMGGDASLKDRLEEMPQDEALEIVLPLVVSSTDTHEAVVRSPLWRRTDTGRPQRRLNVLLVLMESFEARAIGVLGRRKTLSPRFDRLSREGVLFTRFYAAGTRSNRALSAVLSSLPGLPGTSVLRSTRIQQGLFTVGDVLQDRGYTTHVIQSGAADYDNLDAYALANGFNSVVGRETHENPVFETEWGVSDEDLYHRTLGLCDDLADDGEPFFVMCMTQSNHRPYEIPEGRVPARRGDDRKSKKHAAMLYADWALGDFVDRARKKPWFRETLCVFVADHGKDRAPVGGPDVRSFHIPLLLIAPGLPPGRVDGIGGQVDVAPTILGVLGGVYEHTFFGSDLLGPSPPGRAVLTLADQLLWVEGDHVLMLSPGSRQLYAFDGRRPTLLDLSGSDLSGSGPAEENRARADALARKLRATARLAFSLPREGRYVRPASE